MAKDTFEFKKSPWWTFYSAPKSTFERILKDYPEAYAIMMALVSGGCMLLEYFFNRGLEERNIPGAIYLEAFILGPFFGLACFYFAGWFFQVISLRLGGEGTLQRNRVVWAWSFVPYITGMVLMWIPLTIAAVIRAQFHQQISATLDKWLMYVEILFYYAFIPFWAWSLYLLLVGLTVANRYNYRQGVLAIVISYLVLGAVAWLVFVAGHMLGAL